MLKHQRRPLWFTPLVACVGLSAIATFLSPARTSAEVSGRRFSDSVSEAQESSAATAAAAAVELFGDSQSPVAGRTSHFNFDNRPADPNPSRSVKYNCYVHCVLDDGRTRNYTAQDGSLRRVPMGEYRTLDINRFNVRVVKCRFYWKLTRFGRYYHSDWVEADPGNYIVYAFLLWQGHNEYTIDELYQEPISNPAVESEDNSSKQRASVGS